MIALPVGREHAPLATRPVSSRAPATAERERIASVPGAAGDALAEALAKVKTPEDADLAKQQQAFDRLMQVKAEQEREANAIREFGMAQAKKENDFMLEWIRMI